MWFVLSHIFEKIRSSLDSFVYSILLFSMISNSWKYRSCIFGLQMKKFIVITLSRVFALKIFRNFWNTKFYEIKILLCTSIIIEWCFIKIVKCRFQRVFFKRAQDWVNSCWVVLNVILNGMLQNRKVVVI